MVMSSRSSEKIARKKWLEEFGFKFRPFSKDSRTGDGEPIDFDRYFVEFNFYNDFLLNEKTIILFGERGAGKSVNRRMLEIQNRKAWVRGNKSNIKLAVSYREFSTFNTNTTVSVDEHIKNILIYSTQEVYNFFRQTINNNAVESTLQLFGKEFIELLEKYNPDILSKITLKLNVDDDIEKTTSATVKVKLEEAILNNNLLALSEVIKEIPSKESYCKRLFHLWEKRGNGNLILNRSYRNDLRILKHIAKSLKIEQIFILVDEVDQKSNGQAILDMLNPLLNDLSLMESDFYKFNFFLPLSLREGIHKIERFNEVHAISWDEEKLEELLDKRVAYCYSRLSKDYPQQPPTFVSLFEDKIRSRVMEEMIQLTNYSPRDLLKLADTIIQEHTSPNKMELYISEETYDKACKKFRPLINVRSKLEKLSTEKLSILAYDYFRYVYNKFTKKTSQEDKVDLLIDELNQNKSEIAKILKYIEKWR